MKRLKIIPEIFIWLAFSVVAGFGYAFSFFEYIGGRAPLTATDIIMPTLVWILLAAICTFLVGVARKTQCFVHLSRREGLFLEYSVLLLLLIGGWVYRFADHFSGLWPVNPDNEFFQYAQVVQASGVYMNPHPASRLYVGFLHIIFLFLGNIYEAGAVTQFILLLVGVLFWYLAVRKAFGTTAALFLAAGAMLLPDSIVASMQYNPMMLMFAIYGIIAWIMACYAAGKCTGIGAFISELFLGALVSVAVLLDISGWIFVVVCGLALRKHQKNREKKSLFTPIAACLGVVLGEKAFTYVQSVVYGMSFRQAGDFLAYPNLTIRIPTLDRVQEFVFALGTHPIFIVAIVVISTYWLINRRQASTWIMMGELFLLTIQLLKLDIYLQHDFLIYMGLLVLLGISVQQYLLLADKTKAIVETVAIGDTTELPDLSFLSEEKDAAAEAADGLSEESQSTENQQEPVVTVIRFEEQPAVTVPEKEQDRPVIFIPKSMEIPKRVSKPKVEFAVEVMEEKMHYDVQVSEDADFDI